MAEQLFDRLLAQTGAGKYVDNLFKNADHIFRLGFDEKAQCSALAYSDLLYKRDNYAREEMQKLGMQTRFDSAANLIGFYPGKSDKKLMITSHLDSVVNAGRYDGVLGVLLGIEFVRFLVDTGYEPEYSIEVRSCMGEESPGVTATFGSKVATGAYSFEDLESLPLAWQRETPVTEAITRYLRDYAGYSDFKFTPEELKKLQLDSAEYKGALEVHIEQFFLLKELAEKHQSGKPYVGVMTGVGGHLRSYVHLTSEQAETVETHTLLSIVFNGETGHSGATPMGNYRDDAAVKAAGFVLDEAENAAMIPVDFRIDKQSLTSIPGKVELIYALIKEETDADSVIQTLKKKHPSAEITTEPSEKAVTADRNLLVSIAELVLQVNRTAEAAPPADEIRGTVTIVDVESAHKGRIYIDLRGASSQGMKKVMNTVLNTPLKEGTGLEEEKISEKKPVKFDTSVTAGIENILNDALSGRIMKGRISVPGQDIGNLSEYGIPASLLFIESGTGHHPGEYVREEAMLSAFEATSRVMLAWCTGNIN